MFTLHLRLLDADLLLNPPWSSLPAALRWALLALVCVVPLALLAWLYAYELRLVPRLTATGLLGLRLAVLTLLLLLVCLQPVYARTRTRQLPGRVLVVVDRSASLDVADPQRHPADKLRLARTLKLGGDLVPPARLDRWAQDYQDKGEPQWVEDDEARGDPARRRRLEAERRAAHDQVCALVDGLTRAEVARRVLAAEGLGLLPALAGKHDVELTGFHSDAWDLPPGQLGELFGAGPGKATAAGRGPGFTDLRLPLARALEKSGPGRKVLGVVLLTDGQHNAGKPPGDKARELGERGVPVYPVALGDRKPPPDVAVLEVNGPKHTVFKDVDAPFEVRFKVAGMKAQDLLVELRRAGEDKKLLGQKTVRHDGKDRTYAEAFTVRMAEAGKQTLVASVRPLDPGAKETRPDNNTLSTVANVADDKAKVLLIDGEARWEYHYLATALARDRSVELTTVVFEQPRLDDKLSAERREGLGLPREELPAGPDALAGYQCVILGDVPPEKLPPAERRRLERYVGETGGTLVVLAGKRHMPLAYPATAAEGDADPLRKLLPIEAPQALAPEDGFEVSLAQGGREMTFLKLDDDAEENDALWAGRPRPWGWGVVGRVKPGATPLAYVAEEGDDGRPLRVRERRQGVVVRHNYGFGRVLFVGLDSTWRWRYKVGDRHHHRFWGRAVRWAAADKPLTVGNRHVRFGTPQPVYTQGEEVEVLARLGEELGPLKRDLAAGARVLRLPSADRPKGKEESAALVPLAPRLAEPRLLRGGGLRDLPPGRYAVELAIPAYADKLLGADGKKPLRAEFEVLAPRSAEMVDLETRWPLLEELAVKSGGRLFTPEEAGALAELLAAQGVPHTEHHEQRLYQWWVLLAAVVGLLTLEWAGRKWAGLP